jgi:ribulose kinase
MGDRAGELTQAAADDLGLKAGTPVAQGGIDAYAGMLGLGVVHPGRMALVMGSSTCHLALCAEGLFESHVWGPYPDCLLPDTWVLEGGQTATGSIVKWFADNFAAGQAAQAKSEGVDVYEVLDREAAEVPVGAEGLVLIDYFQGNRTPLRDPLARGALWGLSLRHTVPHIFRAIYEGTAFGTRHILEDLQQAGFQAEAIYACGGGTRSDLWLQIHADACRVPICLTQEPEATALGTAVCAAVGAGEFANPVEAGEAMARVTRTIEPNPDNADAYDFYYDKYVRTYPGLRDLMHEVASETES